MSVLCTVTWVIKPECVDLFSATIGEMFLETRKHDGFISIRLLKSDTAENEFALIQEWETTQYHQAYVAFREQRGRPKYAGGDDGRADQHQLLGC